MDPQPWRDAPEAGKVAIGVVTVRVITTACRHSDQPESYET
jgi:hypothetical protein